MRVLKVGPILILLVNYVFCGHPTVLPTKGSIWPMPQSQLEDEGYMIIRRGDFQFTASGHNCSILDRAFERYLKLISPEIYKHNLTNETWSNEIEEPILYGYLRTLEVALLNPCESYPYLHMDEMYTLQICRGDNPTQARLVTKSIWGAIRGLETFAQLALESTTPSELTIHCNEILDFPRFPHRGFMLDSSRHFLPVDTIKSTLDLMGIDKFNVFHWHIVDDPSFPFVSETFPDLSKYGSWSNMHIYSPEDVQEIIDYARDRGLRVLVEFDTPGHTRSWGDGQPGLLTECYSSGKPNGKFGPIDPSKEANFDFLKKLFTEISQKFPDYYLHLGADEVYFDCWRSNPNITAFMESLNMTRDYKKLEEYYVLKLIDIIDALPKRKGYMVWQEVFDNGVKIDEDTIVHVWKYENQPYFYYPYLAQVTNAGYHALLSSCWYLNYIDYGIDWHKFYKCDPQNFYGTEEQKKLVLGGEACMWGEYVDKTNLISRSWPRASPVAERLWSPPEKTIYVAAAEPRLAEHRCRLLKRGYPVEPLWPSYCPGVL